jgi:hypothetical protein
MVRVAVTIDQVPLLLNDCAKLIVPPFEPSIDFEAVYVFSIDKDDEWLIEIHSFFVVCGCCGPTTEFSFVQLDKIIAAKIGIIRKYFILFLSFNRK